MPIKIQSDLPVKEILEKENIFVMDENRAVHQDIRPIKRRDRTAAPPFSFEYPSAGGRFFHDGKEPYF